ncbi:hypothetical protein FE257_012184 [Aspergillus nanangensis]|uniref:Cyclopropane-fatty-acyl-phospholipid synthase n=1 Tax=Aspergillus nanangensis TaxID=2582783 RepID=A0AAD4GS42_ASPNN|nr:hypothetical protein FE257_012184 [Aspergillus nanangensis]
MTAVIEGARSLLSSYVETLFVSSLRRNIVYGDIHLTIHDVNPSTKPQVLHICSKAHPENEKSPQPSTTVVIRNKQDFWLRLCQNVDIGFAEAYMSHEVECEDLVQLFKIYIRNWDQLQGLSSLMQLPVRIWTQLLRKINTENHALANASFHYDTSNAMFQAFLSDDMCYSCPIWSSSAPEEPLEAAQRRKVHAIISRAQIQASHHILDIGGGWGFLAMEAVRLTGCRVTAITLSEEQKQLAEKQIKARGYDDRIRFQLCDYRKTPRPVGGWFDRIVSVEMIEAVGKEFLEEFFGVLSDLLHPEEGRVVIQGITFAENLHAQPKYLDNFLDKYIFPGGYLPSVSELVSCVTTGSARTLEVNSIDNIGPHYTKALRLWREKFIANWDSIKASHVQKYGQRSEEELEAFRRRWIVGVFPLTDCICVKTC